MKYKTLKILFEARQTERRSQVLLVWVVTDKLIIYQGFTSFHGKGERRSI